VSVPEPKGDGAAASLGTEAADGDGRQPDGNDSQPDGGLRKLEGNHCLQMGTATSQMVTFDS